MVIFTPFCVATGGGGGERDQTLEDKKGNGFRKVGLQRSKVMEGEGASTGRHEQREGCTPGKVPAR